MPLCHICFGIHTDGFHIFVLLYLIKNFVNCESSVVSPILYNKMESGLQKTRMIINFLSVIFVSPANIHKKSSGAIGKKIAIAKSVSKCSPLSNQPIYLSYVLGDERARIRGLPKVRTNKKLMQEPMQILM